MDADFRAPLSHSFLSDRSPPMGPHNEEHGERGIDSLAPETLARIFAFLDPVSLTRCARTCRAWNAIVSQDITWCNALMCAFGLEAREERIAAAEGGSDPAWKALRVAPALRRMQPSWRSEYMARSSLLRRWRKSRMPTVLTDPRIGGREQAGGTCALIRAAPPIVTGKLNVNNAIAFRKSNFIVFIDVVVIQGNRTVRRSRGSLRGRGRRSWRCRRCWRCWRCWR